MGEETISFDKDDDDMLDFVTAASNLRTFAYGIETKTWWEVKGMLYLSHTCLSAHLGRFQTQKQQAILYRPSQ
jgi:Ubiquitin-activating enzyme active site